MKNKYVVNEINREVDMVLQSIRNTFRIYRDYQTPGTILTNRETLEELRTSSIEILKFVNHVEALKQVLELPDS
jgi:hypothetical protein